ncbi:hypothetical protein [Flavobacterium sp. 14A]|uniref:hypothetical protein n=1 Tax=Flavobacterium sp. 14A TaxID=2735896 RepID=UPI00156E9EE1|nr:hypothetical protein [Flavobacterium sp. 14A]NRT13632.1 hypothetical protein [Flavobacterium sp. 14A]
MRTDLSTFEFQIISKQSLPVSVVDWEYIKTDKDDVTPQILNFSFDVVKTSDGFEITVNSDVLISCFVLHSISVTKGTFYRYSSKSIFYINTNKINSIIVSECSQAHFVGCINEILFDTRDKTETKNPYLLKVPSLSKIILNVESCDYNYNL